MTICYFTGSGNCLYVARRIGGTPCCNPNPIPVLLIMTSNAPEGYYHELLEKYRQTLSGFVGPTEVFVCGDTLQLKDYSKTDWPWYFDGEAKQRRHDTNL